MKPVFRISDEEARARRSAIAPQESVWVSANAGAGKTTLLRDRVIRMLLEGVAPDRILCLTYTKAAAAEMQDRIFDELARWVELPEDDLKSVVQGLTGSLAPAHLRRARSLFAEAVETPGGLKIQTIHAFAERLLHLFPIEAGVPVDFSVLEDIEAVELREEARRTTLVDAASHPGTRLGRAFAEILRATKLGSFATLTREAMGVLRRIEARGGTLPEDALDAAIEARFGISPDVSEAAIEERFLANLPTQEEALAIGEALLALKPGPSTIKTAKKLMAYGRAEGHAALFEAAYAISIHSDGRSATPPTIAAAALKSRPDLVGLPEMLKAALEEFLETRSQLRSARRSQAMNIFAGAMLKTFSRLKAERRVLDFDDIIITLRRMLQDGRAAWVMMKLDAAIEHILVDEAQDTTPEMWDIVSALTDDFFAGEGQVRRPRSLFVVGDEKQSIFSFQGAEPRTFEEKRQEFAAKIGKGTLVDRPVRLRSSFRSSQDVLDAIDAVFSCEQRRAGLSADGERPVHVAAQMKLPGLVECWPLEETLPTTDNSLPPVPSYQVTSPDTRMARRIAGTIDEWLRTGEISAGQPIGPGDILILVQKRGPFFSTLLRALGERNIPVAGADRLKIQHEIGVQDLIAIASTALLPKDDLSLAIALKTPIFGLDDLDLEPICRQRQTSLRDALALAGSGNPRLAAIEARLRLLEQRAHTLPPFDFLSTLLIEDCPGRTGMSGRAAMLKRLGADAADAIDAFLGDALDFQRRHPPTLALFVAAQAGQERELKRDLDSGQGRVRVMTVHGAKGLEARIVFVADAMNTKHSSTDPKVHVATSRNGGMLLWAGRVGDAAPPIRQAASEARTRAYEEYRRLLYVGLTRARERLYVVGHRIGKPSNNALPGDFPKPPVTQWHWHALVKQAMQEHERVIEVPSPEEGRLPILHWPPSCDADIAEPDEVVDARPDLPALLLQPLMAEPPPRLIRPSQVVRFSAEDRAVPSHLRVAGRKRGVILHRLFQFLPKHPQSEHARLARALVRDACPTLPPHDVEAWIEPVLRALAAPELAAFLAEGSRAEVSMAGPIRLANGSTRHVYGRLDRVCVRSDRVDILDFKTGTRPPAGPSVEILTQMALYRAVAREAFGQPNIACSLYWTENQRFESLEDETLDAAFATITSA
ncbi:MAG: double-strand break repair helicase AddA [Rhizobiales bacterium]|nr:double-strand break repair helicase AddA [Hyphomicrobiales bacterium]